MSLGPGLLESAYQACLSFEMTLAGLRVEQQVPLPLKYGDVELECGYRLDFLVDRNITSK
jgi:GxxExxY protein